MEDKKVCPKCKGTMWRYQEMISGEVGYQCATMNCRYKEVVEKGKITKEGRNLLRELNELGRAIKEGR